MDTPQVTPGLLAALGQELHRADAVLAPAVDAHEVARDHPHGRFAAAVAAHVPLTATSAPRAVRP